MTVGNFGEGVASAASSVGCICVILLHANVSTERANTVAKSGARFIRVAGNYDESVAQAVRRAGQNDWEVVSDTSDEG